MYIYHHERRGDALTGFADALDAADASNPVVILMYDDLDVASDLKPDNVPFLRPHIPLETKGPPFFGGTRDVVRISIVADGLPYGAVTQDLNNIQARTFFEPTKDDLTYKTLYHDPFGESLGYALLVGLWHHWVDDETTVDVLHEATNDVAWLTHTHYRTGSGWKELLDENENASVTGYRITCENDRLTVRPLCYDPTSTTVMVDDED